MLYLDTENIHYPKTATARRAIIEVARRREKSVAEVRELMVEAIADAFHTPDPAVQALWSQIPHNGDIPTPEEFILWMAEYLQSNRLQQSV